MLCTAEFVASVPVFEPDLPEANRFISAARPGADPARQFDGVPGRFTAANDINIERFISRLHFLDIGPGPSPCYCG